MDRDLLNQSIPALANDIAQGRVSAEEVARASLAAIQAHDDSGAFLAVSAEPALAQAREVDARRARGEPLGKLAGIPIGLKDAICTRGIATTAGSRILQRDGQSWLPPYDATVVTKLKAAGAVLPGKTNWTSSRWGSSTENSSFLAGQESDGSRRGFPAAPREGARGCCRADDPGTLWLGHRRIRFGSPPRSTAGGREANLRARVTATALSRSRRPRSVRPFAHRCATRPSFSRRSPAPIDKTPPPPSAPPCLRSKPRVIDSVRGVFASAFRKNSSPTGLDPQNRGKCPLGNRPPQR